MTWYYEKMTLDRWRPVTSDSSPTVKEGRAVANGATGPRVRGVVQVPGDYRHLTLDQMQAVLGPEGHLRWASRIDA